MINPAPLLIVMGTILGLLAVQRLLSRAPLPGPENQHATPVPTPPPRPRGRKLVEGISITGLDERGVASLKALIAKNDLSGITTFLAFNRPGFVEIDAYLTAQKASSAPSSPPSAKPLNHLLDALTSTEREQLLNFNPKAPRLISRELMARFGGHEFNTYFSHYVARERSVALHIPPFDPDRKIMEDLTKTGIARKGRHIPLASRLTVLKMSQLRQMAKDLNLDKKFTRKQDAAQILADVPGAAVLLSMQYVVDDLFILNPIDADVTQVKNEWAYLTAYAKLLAGLK